MIKSFLYDFANCVSFGISLLTIYALLDYYIYASTYLITLTVNMVIFQCAYDMFIWHNNASVIHHIFLLCLASFLHQHNIHYDTCLFLIIPLLTTEISTLFLSIRHWLEQMDMSRTVWYGINNGLFVVTFLVTRLYIYTTYVIYNPDTYMFIDGLTNHNLADCALSYIGLFGLYALNIYWATLIFKILIKPYRDMLSYDRYQQQLLCISPILNVLSTMYIYDFEVNGHVIGAIFLAITATALYLSIFYFPQSSYIMSLYLANQFSYQLLSILTVFTIHGTFFGLMSLSYHLYYLAIYILNSDFCLGYNLTGKSFLYVLVPIAIYNFILEDAIHFHLWALLCLLMTTRYSIILVSIQPSDILVLPLITDVVTLIVASMAETTAQLNFGLVSYCLLLLIYIKPFYNQNPVVVYIVSFLYGCLLVKL